MECQFQDRSRRAAVGRNYHKNQPVVPAAVVPYQVKKSSLRMGPSKRIVQITRSPTIAAAVSITSTTKYNAYFSRVGHRLSLSVQLAGYPFRLGAERSDLSMAKFLN